MAGVTREARAARDRLADRVAVGALTATFPPELVGEVVRDTGRRELRERDLPARSMVYFSLGTWLWPSLDHREVLRRTLDGLTWVGLRSGETRIPGSGSLAKARARLGPEPLEAMFDRVAGTPSSPGADGDSWRGLRPTVVEGLEMRVTSTPSNRSVFPSHGQGPRVRLLTHVTPGDRNLIDAAFDPPDSAGRRHPVPRPRNRSSRRELFLLDPTVCDHSLWRRAEIDGFHLLQRSAGAAPSSPLERLGDGTLICEIPSHGGRDAATRVRIIEDTPSSTPGGSEAVPEPLRLATTLLSPERWPREEVVELYRRLWKGGTVKRTVCDGADVTLRSQTPEGVRQEAWALLCVHQALVRLRPPHMA
ncbi:transposase domain-containing protein [Nocardiopsis alba]|uniref:transposase domain-containing protein n=1 Tax=Nocardiopsis alba TaxID=53437 RepID=UPI0035E17C75